MSATAARWARLVAELGGSGLTVREFAARRAVNPSTLAWWKWNLRSAGRSAEPGFVELVVAPPVSSVPVRVRIDGKPFTIEVGDGANVDLVRAVVAALC